MCYGGDHAESHIMNLLAIVPLCLTLQGPLDNLKATYPYGDQFAMSVTPDGLRGIVAEGASVAILDLTGLASRM
jgi:hypothetical protein